MLLIVPYLMYWVPVIGEFLNSFKFPLAINYPCSSSRFEFGKEQLGVARLLVVAVGIYITGSGLSWKIYANCSSFQSHVNFFGSMQAKI